jgi:PAS domain S-box-containing protein
MNAERLALAIIDAAQDGIVTINADDLTIYFVNDAVERLSGYSRSELLGREVTMLMRPEDREAHRSRLRRYLASGVRQVDWAATEAVGVHKDGTQIPIQASYRELALDGERLITAVVRDGKPQVSSEQELRSSRDLFGSILEHVPVRVFWKDVESRYLGCNTAFARDAGMARPEDLIGKDDFQMSWRDQAERYRADDRQVIESGQPRIGYEEPQTASDGRRSWLRTSKVPLYDAGGKVVGVLGIYDDITTVRQLEGQYRQAQKMEAIGTLAAGVAHDFNNALSVILGLTDLVLMDMAVGDPRRPDLELVRKAATEAAGLTRQLLAFSRQQVLQPRVLDLNEVVTGAERMLRRLIGEDIVLATALASKGGRVKTDPGQLESVIMNLVVNARDAMPGGGKLTIATANVTLDAGYVEAHPPVTPGRYVLLSVSDTGVGMDAETRRRLFEPFFTTKEKGKGTGLGLATVYGIVKQSGGFIWVYSERGAGTTFKIYLPRVEESVAAAEPPPSSASLSGTETVLLAEDGPMVRASTRSILERHGYTVLEAPNGTAALELAASHAGPLDLLLTDVIMPGMGGGELARRVQARRSETRVLYISGYTDDAVVRHGVLERGDAYLEKPFTSERLLRRVRQVLDAPLNPVDRISG